MATNDITIGKKYGIQTDEDDTPIPPGAWTVTEFRETGAGKRVAKFDHEEHGRVVILPHKAYEIGGFPNAHRVLHTPEPGTCGSVVVEGLAVEQTHEAEEVAVETMNDLIVDGQTDH
jgi:hypothetical protein